MTTKGHFTVVSYNVLSSKLISSHTTKRNPEFLKNEYRLNIIRDEFLRMMAFNNRPIFALQEVSKEWSEEFAAFFSRCNYGFYWAKGTVPFNGYMGVAIAWPLEFKLQKLEVVMPGSFIVPEPPKPLPVVTFSQKWRTWARNVLLLPPIPVVIPPLSDRAQAAKKTNEVIIATFEDVGLSKTFVVATYHMPCAFTQPELMRLHTEALIAIVKTKAGDNPLVLLGDFNAMPDSEVYKMLTSEFMSAYSPEPKFTNKALYKYDTMTSPVEFCGTIDYVFSRGLSRVSTLPVENLENNGQFYHEKEGFVGEYLPTARFPSDHLPVGASYNFLSETVGPTEPKLDMYIKN